MKVNGNIQLNKINNMFTRHRKRNEFPLSKIEIRRRGNMLQWRHSGCRILWLPSSPITTSDGNGPLRHQLDNTWGSRLLVSGSIFHRTRFPLLSLFGCFPSPARHLWFRRRLLVLPRLSLSTPDGASSSLPSSAPPRNDDTQGASHRVADATVYTHMLVPYIMSFVNFSSSSPPLFLIVLIPLLFSYLFLHLTSHPLSLPVFQSQFSPPATSFIPRYIILFFLPFFPIVFLLLIFTLFVSFFASIILFLMLLFLHLILLLLSLVSSSSSHSYLYIFHNSCPFLPTSPLTWNICIRPTNLENM